MEINEKELMSVLDSTKTALLIEPKYKRKYIPLGLSKIATYIKNNGGNVVYSRDVIGGHFDAIFVTSLFTYDSEKVADSLNELSFMYPKTPVYMGGVYASLMPVHAKQRSNAIIFKGYSKSIDLCPPDYTIDWELDKPWDTFSFCFTSRGCPNKCPYCAVWRIEPDRWINHNWKKHIATDRPNVMISDNNLSALKDDHIEDVVRYLSDNKKKVVFDNGFDCKHITKGMAELLSSLKFTRSGMRLAFDRIEEDGMFQNAVRLLKDNGVPKSQIMAYTLFNFKDTPQEAYYRMRECVKLGIRPYPQQYTPLNKTDRKDIYIGKHWTKNLVRVYRFYWLMAGYFTKMTFEEFVDSQDKYTLSDIDWEHWKTERKQAV